MEIGTVIALTSFGFTLLSSIIGGIVKLNTLRSDLEKEKELRVAGDANLEKAATARDTVYDQRHGETRETLNQMNQKLDTLLQKVH